MAVEAELLSLADVQAAADRIRPHIVATPTISGEAVAGAGVWLKAENLQRTGSFKVRGAVNAVLQLSVEQRRRGARAGPGCDREPCRRAPGRAIPPRYRCRRPGGAVHAAADPWTDPALRGRDADDQRCGDHRGADRDRAAGQARRGARGLRS